MTTLESYDPGVQAIGAARWVDRRLVAAFVLKAPGLEPAQAGAAYLRRLAVAWPYPDEVAVESMEWTGVRATTPQDLIAVQTVGGMLAGGRGALGHVALLGPSRWKASVRKDIHHDRNRNVLDERERAILDAAVATSGARAKEVLDAVGIGLYHLARTNRSGGARR